MSALDETYTPVVIDLETTMKCPVGNNKANPFWPDNDVVLYGVQGTFSTSPLIVMDKGPLINSPKNLMYVGHNIAFDMHYMLVKRKITASQLATFTIWDTQLAEYLLSGQTQPYPSLDDTAIKRGGTLKDDKVAVMFAAGKGADEVPTAMLREYLRGDLNNTVLVFKSQVSEAVDKGMMPLLCSQMEARQATIDMVWNGLSVDKDFLEKRIAELTTEVDILRLSLENGKEFAATLDLTSPTQLGTYIFGGTVKEKRRVQEGYYKNGNPKFKAVTEEIKITGFHPEFNIKYKGASGKCSTDDETLKYVLGTTKSPILASQLKDVLMYRAKNKELTTYFESIHSLIMPDGKVHHNLNHCVTRTGRLSGTNPNMTNVTDSSRSDIKKAFVSRWGKDGVILEADYSQLEMVMLAVLSGDKQLMEDIVDGVDTHSELYRSMYKRLPTKEQRKAFKPCSFALVYGAGAAGIATQSGMSKEDARRFIQVFYARYPNVKIWHEEMWEAVLTNRVNMGKHDKDTGIPVGESCHQSPMSGRLYIFNEYVNTPEVKLWKKETCSFSPTEVKNYPVQGGATGDIVPMVLGKLYRVLRNNTTLRDRCLLINTVHDSVVFDIHNDVLELAISVIKVTMESAPEYIKQTFGFNFPLPLKVGMSYGPNWMEQSEVDFEVYKTKAA
ncbi:PolA DNA polymerase I - 3'-5' exonuclease and polymerase domains [uncultured Caudovirales phage]|uniref:PolA DNA polymerase I - 3'-5' exonuclease and polymerase domains n=1 Tax=uncultured Caudovirales phage TaxID=2100421 RepID=A0A6J5QJ20_9CAUD|nr:PolA DNA polymerase I - 3'-5' exonuclease and polymerase domains [uncultured Caudovirales phage]CAB4182416.1 PolA DNA polymerase I - 3'-5' exonuclease and polymerase domains [uncultured Caudovirales phage]CAB4197778.1 PolA DNA polymerase I - 3'-5' exonuclease and polymerase domains [uncultured Caudovirales phage]CAB4212548.1 PolA DNA polymerase I - 3'-5' exonuclease and polymerase domains [uncultured Caudovirales phage]CAB5227181.1 PolA DNA polymerase I - 3'-5' exonuclease and polymerase dom